MKAFVFDLDGTLLDTLRDIRRALNAALSALGYPFSYSLKETKSFIGRGTDVLCHKALGEMDDSDAFSKLKQTYMPLYGKYQSAHSKPYNGMPETLAFLRNRGYSLYVLSNKPDELAKAIVANFYPGIFREVEGARDDMPKKPDPTMLLDMLNRNGLKPEDILYVGDSKPDIELGESSGAKVGLCTWGYGQYKPELLSKASYVFSRPKDLLKALFQ